MPKRALERSDELARESRPRLPGMCLHRFWDTKSPFYQRLPQVPGFGVDVPAGEIGLILTGAVAGATILHGIASAVRDRPRHETTPPESQKTKPDNAAQS